MNKKLVSLALASTLVAGSMSIGFAAGELTANIDDSKVVKAVERLAAFGIIDGMDDGQYHPELEVTREQFAKVLVDALGLGSAAAAAQGGTQFADVEAGRWSAGYVNVAVGQGILKGYPDGTFKPANKVTYAEAVTMLVRALGYQDAFLPGSWPGNYVAKAAEEGITKDVVFAPTGVADRGSMAVMVDNTLDADVVKIEEYGTLTGTEITYRKVNVSLLEEKLEVSKLEEAIVLSTPKVDNAIDEDQIKVELTENYDKDDDGDDEYEKGDEKTFDVLDTVDVENALGLSLNVYINDDEEVVYVEESKTPFKVIYDVVDVESDLVVNEDKNDEITLIKLDKDYELEDDYIIYLDNEEVTVKEFAAQVKEEGNHLFVKAVLSNKGNIKVIDAFAWDGAESGVVKEASESTVVYFENDADDEETFKAKDYDKVVVMDNNGNSMTLADIEKNDVIYINDVYSRGSKEGDALEEAASGDEVAYVVVVRDSVTGNVERYNQDKFEVRIDGTTYDVTDEATVSSTDDKEIVDFDDTDEGKNALDDMTAADEDALVILDAKGYVRHVTTDVAASSGDLYGVVTGKDTDFGDVEVKILTNDETEVKYDFDIEPEDVFAYGAGADETAVAVGDVVKYTLDSDGEIDSIQKIAGYIGNIGDDEDDDLLAAAGEAEDFTPEFGPLDTDFTDDSLEVDDEDYVVSSDVLVFDYSEAVTRDDDGLITAVDQGDIEVVSFASLEEKGKDNKVVFFRDDNDEVQLIVLTQQVESEDERAAYVVNAWTSDNEPLVELAEFDKEGTPDFEIDNLTAANNLDAETVVIFTENSDGTIDVSDISASGESEEDDFNLYTGKVRDIDGKYLTLEEQDGSTIKIFKAESDVVVYETDDEKDFSDIDDNDYVTAAVKDGKAQVIKLYKSTDSVDMDLLETAYEAHNEGATFEVEDGEDGEEAGEAVTYLINAYADGFDRLTLEDADGEESFVTVADFDAVYFNAVEVTADQMSAWLAAETLTNVYVEVTDTTKLVVKDADAATAATELATAKEDAAALTEAEYTAATWSDLEDALDDAEASTAEMTAKTTAINTAIGDLVYVVTDLTVEDDAVVTALDNDAHTLTVAAASTVADVKGALSSDYDAVSIEVLDAPAGNAQGDAVVVTTGMVVEVVAEDNTTTQEFAITVQ
jgi:hypothetical protein